ncbi:hypothetical protein BDR22DRAFT_89638 [Usnea florida]
MTGFLSVWQVDKCLNNITMSLTSDMRKAISKPTVATSLLFTQRAGTIILYLLGLHIPFVTLNSLPKICNGTMQTRSPTPTIAARDLQNFLSTLSSASAHMISIKVRNDEQPDCPPSIDPRQDQRCAHHSGILQADHFRQLSNKYHGDRMIGPPKLAQNPEPDPET